MAGGNIKQCIVRFSQLPRVNDKRQQPSIHTGRIRVGLVESRAPILPDGIVRKNKRSHLSSSVPLPYSVYFFYFPFILSRIAHTVELETYRTGINTTVSWVLTLCNSVDGYKRSDETTASVFKLWLPATRRS
jgi:hypothetical protein